MIKVINFINPYAALLASFLLIYYMTYLCMTYITHRDTVVLCMKIIQGIHNGHTNHSHNSDHTDHSDHNGHNRHIGISALAERRERWERV
jgi:hypothetical protein